MTALSTILVTGNGTGSREWFTQSYLDIDEGIAGADSNEIAAATGSTLRAGTAVTSFLAPVVEADVGNVDTLFYQVRYRADNATGDDAITLAIRVMNGAQVLAADGSGGQYQSVFSAQNNSWPTSMVNSSVVEFNYVNTTATQADWDAAQIFFYAEHAQTMGPDDNFPLVGTVELTGTYTIAGKTTSGVLNGGGSVAATRVKTGLAAVTYNGGGSFAETLDTAKATAPVLNGGGSFARRGTGDCR